jgi:hypothetical protein
MMVRRIFGPKREEVTRSWGKLHNEELHNLYSSPSIIKMIKSRSMRWIGHVARTGRSGIYIRRKETRPKHRWMDNIRMDLREIGWGDMDWIDLAQDSDQWRALMNTAINLQIP